MKDLEIKEQVHNFTYKLQSITGYYGLTSTAIELMFLKYLCDFDKVNNPEDFKSLMSYKNMFINKVFSKETTLDVLRIINNYYKIEDDLLVNSIYLYEEIFKDSEKSESIFKLLNEFELPKDNENMIKFINYVLDINDNDVKRSLGFSTNESLSKLVNQILNVKENEIYLDCFAGFNRTALNINASKYLGYEINFDVAVISNMVMILSNKNNFNIKNKSFYLDTNKEYADKVFADGPIGLKLLEKEYEFKEKGIRLSDYLNIKKSVECLKENGIAVITARSSVLSNESFKELRKSLTEFNLKAVISLPPLWSATLINTNLLIFEKDRKNNEIIMIDSSNEKYLNKNNKRNSQLKDETIEDIMKSLKGEDIKDFSKIIDVSEIFNNDFLWQPQVYIKKKEELNFRPSKEIKGEIEKAYKELIDLLK